LLFMVKNFKILTRTGDEKSFVSIVKNKFLINLIILISNEILNLNLIY